MMFQSYGNREGQLTIDGNATWIRTLSDRFYTSKIKGYELEEDIVKLMTLNSVYTFKLIDCEFDASGIKSIQDEKHIRHHDLIKQLKAKKWRCQIDAGYLDGLRSVVTLPDAMTREQAMSYIINEKIRDDYEGERIKVLLEPYLELSESNEHQKKSADWLCETPKGFISSVSLPNAYNIEDAMAYVSANNLLDNFQKQPILKLIMPLYLEDENA